VAGLFRKGGPEAVQRPVPPERIWLTRVMLVSRASRVASYSRSWALKTTSLPTNSIRAASAARAGGRPKSEARKARTQDGGADSSSRKR